MSDPCFRRINRNIVECKDGYKFFNINAVNVLIETLWNVKRGTKERIEKLDLVLIETLWNVKRTSRFVFRILRSVLIETLWNVKTH